MGGQTSSGQWNTHDRLSVEGVQDASLLSTTALFGGNRSSVPHAGLFRSHRERGKRDCVRSCNIHFSTRTSVKKNAGLLFPRSRIWSLCSHSLPMTRDDPLNIVCGLCIGRVPRIASGVYLYQLLSLIRSTDFTRLQYIVLLEGCPSLPSYRLP